MIAETRAAAADAAEHVRVAYDDLPAVITARTAVKDAFARGPRSSGGRSPS